VTKLSPMKRVGYRNAHFKSTVDERWPKALASLQSQSDLPFEVYDQVVTEPTEESWRNAIAWARHHDISHFLAYVSFHTTMNIC
jgi:hypothetical protein